METVKRYRLVCPGCSQEGVLEEVERYEIPDTAAPGDCADDMRIYFYEFRVLEGEFELSHADPNNYEHRVVCKKCGKQAKEERIRKEF